MSTYYGSCLSNFFKVKDLEKFEEWISKFPELETFGPELGAVEGETKDYVAFGSTEIGIPEYMPTEDGEDIEVDFISDLYKHLQEGEVAIVQEIGNEKLLYFTGYSLVIDWQGNTKYFSIADAYDWANEKYGREICRCD